MSARTQQTGGYARQERGGRGRGGRNSGRDDGRNGGRDRRGERDSKKTVVASKKIDDISMNNALRLGYPTSFKRCSTYENDEIAGVMAASMLRRGFWPTSQEYRLIRTKRENPSWQAAFKILLHTRNNAKTTRAKWAKLYAPQHEKTLKMIERSVEIQQQQEERHARIAQFRQEQGLSSWDESDDDVDSYVE